MTLIVIKAAPGGSFVGLGAMLFALMRLYSKAGVPAHFRRSFLPGLILPALQVGRLILAAVFRPWRRRGACRRHYNCLHFVTGLRSISANPRRYSARGD